MKKRQFKKNLTAEWLRCEKETAEELQRIRNFLNGNAEYDPNIFRCEKTRKQRRL